MAVGSRSLAVTTTFLRKQLWVWPVLALVVLSVLGTWLRSTIEGSLKTTLKGQLQALLDADVTALRIWMQSQEATARAAARAQAVRRSVQELLAVAQSNAADRTLLQAPQAVQLRDNLKHWLDAYDYVGFIVVDRRGRIIASAQDELVGKPVPKEGTGFVDTVLGGKATVTRPFRSISMLPDESGQLVVGLPTMFAAAPVVDDADQPVAVLALRMRPDKDFTRILNVARFGASGETYAFGQDGIILSESRFDDDLKQLGLLPDQKSARSALTLELRDPGVDLTAGERPPQRRSEQPLNRMVTAAVTGQPGVDVDGHRDYRGVPSAGAWTWLPDHDFGVATEVDLAEAYRPLYLLRKACWVLFGLVAAGAAAIFIFTVVVARLQRAMRQAVLEAKQLGQYTLEEKMGAGGMGVVYRGRHALLRRPTAVKLLDPAKTNDLAIARFEREVQLTSQLSHPNTIAVYDYGRTPEGVFYYAMEYLEGITLDTLVGRKGPLPDGRVIRVLVQVCGSLREAHGVGLIHRDIKPANIMLTRRGGLFDFVKLLDFGLVKAVDTAGEQALTAANALAGTPLYMAPESIENPDRVDPRCDLYSLGAVGYFLLTGKPVFEGQSVLEICRQHVSAPPVPPSERLGRPVAPDLERVVLACLAKRPEDRPASATDLAARLAACTPSTPWTDADAEAWWLAYATQQQAKTTLATLDPFPKAKPTSATLDPQKTVDAAVRSVP
jgi:serine/threonine protein kinase